MRSLLTGTLVIGLGTAMALSACVTKTGGGGDDGGGATGNTTSVGGSGSGGDATGGSMMTGCTEVTGVTEFQTFFANAWYGTAVPSLGGADPDFLEVDVTEGASGNITLNLVSNVEECTDTASCVILSEDETQEGVSAWFFAKSGTLTIDSLMSPNYVSGSMADVTLVEATLDGESGAVSEVAGGRCVHVTSLAFELAEPTPGWTCDPSY